MGKVKQFVHEFTDYLRSLVNISDHIDIVAATDNIRQNIRFRGPNVVILMCAIFIASLGLNVNSTAVIIGAMLISPLMGPIIGIGLSLGTNDVDLLKASLRNWAVMVAISILVATIYFVLSPLDMETPTELLARTNPTIYDVLIALFGGIAGILEISRKDKGTVMSGVAIATALMPPLCTVGYGIAQLNIRYTIGALYLFFINSVFIALATFFMVKYMHFPITKVDDATSQKRRTRYITIAIFILIIPSVYTAYKVVKENNFRRQAVRFIAANRNIGKTYVYDSHINNQGKTPTIELFLGGDKLSDADRSELHAKAEEYGFRQDCLVLHEYAVIEQKAFNEQEIIKDIFENNEQQLQLREQRIKSLEAELAAYKEAEMPFAQLTKEIASQYPAVVNVTLTNGKSVNAQTGEQSPEVLICLRMKQGTAFSDTDKQRLQNWLSIRLEKEQVVVIIE
ncbi:MAG: DUF389 domain-containing protein [Paludibacter sp.]|nr:DUF389 domain-containing protein [Bacteroidales bacterium]MCM1068378.1 DUF389 domain-containing protein [Prevotella sp.]MCM1354527.1 DUF389 domain-containing protein [Bacteroides sp.]MCM1443444.1 DUF389 domain-containing protein [Muribaculum sp.]MCM1482655.1 DUF389 domain-containing protein [Paludibacter sp.]